MDSAKLSCLLIIPLQITGGIVVPAMEKVLLAFFKSLYSMNPHTGLQTLSKLVFLG